MPVPGGPWGPSAPAGPADPSAPAGPADPSAPGGPTTEPPSVNIVPSQIYKWEFSKIR